MKTREFAGFLLYIGLFVGTGGVPENNS
jgi:hypothetical protein